jgi:endonuclease III
MSFEEKVVMLIKYIKSLKDFNIVKPDIPVPYNHMGATITDAMLQAGTTWDTVVKPRIKKLLNYSEAKTTTGFLKLLEREGIKRLLSWDDDEKPTRILKVVCFFETEKIETETDLKTWLENDDNIEKLKKLRGIGNKTADYFKILVGISTSAIDRHLIEFLKQAGIDISINNYWEAQKIINKAAEKMEIDKSLLDHSIWKYMSIKKNKRLCKKGHSR